MNRNLFKEKQTKLPWQQWWMGYAVVLSIIFVIVISQFSRMNLFNKEVGTRGYLKAKYFEVTIKGAVQFPGTYVLPKGADMARLLQRARPHPEADVKSLCDGSKLRDGQVVNVRKKAMITVYLQGAVANPGALRLSKGAKMGDLRKKALLLEDADISSLQGKRKLKDGEVVAVRAFSSKFS